MLKKLILILSILCIGVSSLFAQAKVGTTGAQFLLLSPSVKSNGMGQVGMAVVNSNSYYFNPANLGLLIVQNNISLSVYPGSSNISEDVGLFNLALTLPMLHQKLTNSDFYFGGAYYYKKLTADDLIERTYERGTIEGIGRTFSWKDVSHNFVFSFAKTGTIDAAFGVTAKYFKQTTHDYSADGFAFDIGGVVRYNIKSYTDDGSYSYVIPAIGLAVRNLGPDMTFISKSAPLPRIIAFGNSVELGQKKQFSDNQTAQVYNVIAAIDIEKHTDDNWIYKFGVDISFKEIINLRVGKITDNTSFRNETTYGFSLSTFRIGKFKMLTSDDANSNTGDLLSFLYNKLNIEYNFASYDRDFLTNNQNYHEIVITYQL